MDFDIREHLDKLEKRAGRSMYKCPVCGGNRLSVRKDGVYTCWSGECNRGDIAKAINPDWKSEVSKPPTVKRPPKKKARPVVVTQTPYWRELPYKRNYPKPTTIERPTWAKKDIPTHECTIITYRYGESQSAIRLEGGGKKTMRPCVEGGIGKGDRPWEAYRLSEAIKHGDKDNWIFAVEGEKTVEAMRFIGYPCITWQGGAWTDKDFSRTITQLKESKVAGLIYIPDHDKAGYKKADKVLAACAKHSYPCLVLDPLEVWEDMPEKGDIADWVEYGEREEFSTASYEDRLLQASSQAVKLQYKEPEPVTAPKQTDGDRPIVAETTRPLKPHRPETKRIHGGYKELKVVELNDFVDEVLGDRLSFDNLQCEVLIDEKPIKFGADLKFWFFNEFGESATPADIYSCFLYKARLREFNPVKRYLEDVHSKTKPISIDDIATRYFGTTDPIYDRMTKMWLISAVARVFDPGCQVDHTLILQSGQGKYKSTWFKTLGGAWFSDSVKDIENKDSLLTIHSSWILELAEINRVTSKKQAAIVKHFLTQREDTFRKPYDKEVERNQRRSVFCGTVNPSRFLVDDENRRFWVIPVSDELPAIDIPMLERERDAIWAAAVQAYQDGEPWYPTNEEKLAIAELTKEFMDTDVWMEPVEAYIKTKPYVSVYEILVKCFEMRDAEMGRKDQMRVAKILDQLGWTKTTRKSVYGKKRRVRLNPNWLESEGMISNSTTNQLNINNINGQVGKVGKSIDTQEFESDQPTDQPQKEVGTVERSVLPTSVTEVGQPEAQSQQGVYRRTNQNIPIPQKYSRLGFKYSIGTECYLVGTKDKVILVDYGDSRPGRSDNTYLTVDPQGKELYYKQGNLVAVDEYKRGDLH